MSDKLPVKVGIEVEANYPAWSFDFPPEIEEVLLAEARTTGNVINQSSSPDSHQRRLAIFDLWRGARHYPGGERLTQLFNSLAAPYRLPDGWLKQEDGSAGLEFKFSGPSQSDKDVHSRIDNLLSFFGTYQICSFNNAGTHIHLGVMEWLQDAFSGDSTSAKLIRRRAENLLVAYFNTRSRALQKLMPPVRRCNSYCNFPFNDATASITIQPAWAELVGESLCRELMPSIDLPAHLILTPKVSASMPPWALHNAILMASNAKTIFGISDHHRAISHLRHHPTTEFRLFPGTASKAALIGYYRLVLEMFNNFSKVCENPFNLRSLEKTDEVSPFVVNPYKFGVHELLSELKSPWLKNWVTKTHAADGTPPDIAIDATEDNVVSEPVAA